MEQNINGVTPVMSSLIFHWLQPEMKHSGDSDSLGMRAGIFEFAADSTTETVAKEFGTIIVRVLDGALTFEPDAGHEGNGIHHLYDENASGFSEVEIGTDEIQLNVNDWISVNNILHRLYTAMDQTATISVTVVQPEALDLNQLGCRPCPTYPL